MGLDVYLYKHEDYEKERALNETYEIEFDAFALWKEVCGDVSYNDCSEDLKETYRSKSTELRTRLGLNDSYEIEGTICIEEPSKLYPDHYFKLGYFRSSYNDGGINSVLGKLMGKDLYYIFKPQEDYAFKPDWEQSLSICNEMIAELKSFLQRLGKYKISFFGQKTFLWLDVGGAKTKSERAALEVFLKEIESKKDHDYNYSSMAGEFFMHSPLKVVAIIQAKNGIYAIYDGGGDEEDEKEEYVGYWWYLQALEIVKETIEYVLSQPDIDKYYLHWSS